MCDVLSSLLGGSAAEQKKPATPVAAPVRDKAPAAVKTTSDTTSSTTTGVSVSRSKKTARGVPGLNL